MGVGCWVKKLKNLKPKTQNLRQLINFHSLLGTIIKLSFLS
jgi:hypothetical protein